MTEDIVHALRAGLRGGGSAALVTAYEPGATLESYLDGHRRTAVGRAAIGAAWPGVMGEAGTETHVDVAAAPGGYDIDIQRRTAPGGRAVRQLHRLHVVDGRVRHHLVRPARPREDAILPAGAMVEAATEIAHGGFSGAALFRARTAAGEPVVVKYIQPAGDWLARASGDLGREGQLCRDGVYRALPPPLASPVIDAHPVESGWLVVMRDVSPALDRVRRDPGRLHRQLLDAARAMHAKFAGAEASPALGTLEKRLQLFSPLRPLIERHGEDLLPKLIERSWECFADDAGDDLVAAVLRLVAEPAALVGALRAEAPSTLLHGDYRGDNLGVEGPTVIALDWGLATYGPAEVDFTWFLSNTAWGGDADRSELEAIWAELTGNGPASRAMDLAVIFHAVMGEVAFVMAEARHQLPGFDAAPSPETVEWWVRRMNAAFERCGPLV